MMRVRFSAPMGMLLLAAPWRTTERSSMAVSAFAPIQCPKPRVAEVVMVDPTCWWSSTCHPTLSLRPGSSAPRRRMSAGDGDSQPPPSSSNDEKQQEPDASAAASSSSLSSDTTDILNSPVFLRRKLEVLQKDMQVTQKELEAAQDELRTNKAEWSSQLDELAKEYQQIQSRMNAQNSQGDSMATIQVVRQMLGVLDTFDRAFGVVQPTTDEERNVEAEYRNVYEQILQTFTQLGVEVVPTVGAEFDYEIHQAVMQRPSDEHDEGVVCEELQKGFKLGDQLVRAAMVVVAA